MIGYDRRFAETIQAAYYKSVPPRRFGHPLSDESWKERILRAGAKMAKSNEAEIELEKNPELWCCADPSDYFCRTTGVIDSTVILAPKETALKIIVLGLP